MIMKCNPGYEVKIGDIPVDPCVYEEIEVHSNVTVEVWRCKNCGHIEIVWRRQEDTIDELG